MLAPLLVVPHYYARNPYNLLTMFTGEVLQKLDGQVWWSNEESCAFDSSQMPYQPAMAYCDALGGGV